MKFLGLKKIVSKLRKERFFLIAALIISVIFLCSVGIYCFEHARADSSIHSVWDGIWWAVVTICTVGYGDKIPVSDAGRAVAFLLMISGVILLSLLTATIASVFVEQKIREGKGLETIRDKDHIVICGWNENTEEVLTGLTTYGSMSDILIVLINELPIDEIDTLKLKYDKHNLKFLRGNYVYEDVLLRANIQKAKFALIMADLSGSHVGERTDERTILAALTIRSIAPHIKTIAELLDVENKQHLERANVDEIVVRGEHIGSLLASAISYPGLPRVFSSILSLSDKNNLRRAGIPSNFVGRTFEELSKFYREKEHAILIGLLKEKKAMRLEDLLSDDTSVIDTFIREKLKESKKDIFLKDDEAMVVVNPDDKYIIVGDDYAVILS
ncbi:MAG: potassium channel family protein [Thermodesulfobacteriota bacterium]|nr:potassium channel family protein [Thermodesulfobacteriota bacterium]